MSQDNEQGANNEINISSIKWSKMTPEEFHALEKKLQERHAHLKIRAKKKKNSNVKVQVKIKGQFYYCTREEADRLKTLMNEKAKEKLIKKIIADGPITINEL